MRSAFQRLAAPVAVGFGLIAVTLVLNVGLQLSTALAPGWLPFRLAGAGFENDIVQRIAAAESQYRDGSLRGEKFLCVLIGLSGLRESADLKTMTTVSADRCRYLGLSGAGGAIDTLTEQTRRLLDGSLRPDVAIIGITDFLQVKPLPPKPGAGEASPWADAARHGDIRLLAKMAKDGLWFIERRRDVNGAVESALMDGKQTMLRVLGADAVSQLNPLTDPWREMIRLEVPEHASDTALRNGIAAYEARALYEPASYERGRIQQQTEALNELISKLRARGTQVIVALMPEHSLLRARLPAEAMRALHAGLDNAFGADIPPLLDLRDVVPDSGFTDISHVNAEGRKIVSQLIADRVTQALPQGGAPLMHRP